jgi:aminoglycoside 3-N-acetyltransferase
MIGAPLPVTRGALAQAFRSLGLDAGQSVMLHASVKAVGPVMGGPNVILQALQDALGPDGTVMMYVGWHDIPDFVLELPPDARALYYAEHPPFDPVTARAVRDHGIMAEVLRTWPGAWRSLNPEASMVAVGARAAWLTRDHPLDYGYGAGSPLAKLVEIGGQVLMLGAPLDTITLLHHAEYRAALRHKHVIRYQCPILRDGQAVWVDVEDFATGDPHDDYSFEAIARDYLTLNRARRGTVGQADSYLFGAADLVAFAVTWLETRFGA